MKARKRKIAKRVALICSPRRTPSPASHLLAGLLVQINKLSGQKADGLAAQALLSEAAALLEGPRVDADKLAAIICRLKQIDIELIAAMAKIGHVWTPHFGTATTLSEVNATPTSDPASSKETES